jgi:hypothetical protein
MSKAKSRTKKTAGLCLDKYLDDALKANAICVLADSNTKRF